MKSFSITQLKLLAGFFSNMAVVWFVAAFIEPKEPITMLRAIVSGGLSIIVALFLVKEVDRE